MARGEATAVPPITSADERDARVAALFRDEYGALCRVAALLIGDRARAEEVVMDAFAATLVGWRRIRDLDAAPAYLRRAVVNRCHTAQTRRGREQRANARIASQPDLADPPVPQELSHVGAAVRQLPPRQRACVVLTYFLDLPEAEVAAALNCAPGTVKSQLSKARVTLARLLAEDAPHG